MLRGKKDTVKERGGVPAFTPSSLKVLALSTEPLRGSASARAGSADQAQPGKGYAPSGKA